MIIKFLKKHRKLLKIKHLLELALVLPIYMFFRILPLSLSSFLIGNALYFLGRFSKTHQTALKNLRFCFREKSEREINSIALDSWENLGRTAGELPHITSYSNDKMYEICSISGLENVEAAQEFSKQNNTGMILVSAHYGNWEIASRMLLALDADTALIYRKANNPYVEDLIQNMRGSYTNFIIPKGDRGGVKDIVKHIKSGGRLGILMDQKSSDGVDVDFFGKKVKTASTVAELAIKFNSPIVMGRVIRDDKTKLNFILKFDSPIYPEDKTAEEINQYIYSTYERWIKEYPNQWFWQHNRFGLK